MLQENSTERSFCFFLFLKLAKDVQNQQITPNDATYSRYKSVSENSPKTPQFD